MRAALIKIIVMVAALGGCATSRDRGPPPTADTISFAAGACLGACPIYKVIVEPDGSAVLYPQKFTSVPGETRFTVTPQQYRQLRSTLAPFRPQTGTEKRIEPGKACANMATDMPGYTIAWSRSDRRDTKLYYYSGCLDPQYARLRAAVAAVPRLIDIEKMLKIGH